jgi:hypothetical protein
MTLCIGCPETFGPTDQNSLIDPALTGEISEFNGLIDVVDVVYSRARI